MRKAKLLNEPKLTKETTLPARLKRALRQRDRSDSASKTAQTLVTKSAARGPSAQV
jgi:hypothetical protein